MQKQCLELADQKIGLMEQFEKSLDSHLNSLNTQIDKAEQMLDSKEGNGEQSSNGLSLTDFIKVASSEFLQLKPQS